MVFRFIVIFGLLMPSMVGAQLTSNCYEGAYLNEQNQVILINGSIESPVYRNITTGRAGLMASVSDHQYSLTDGFSGEVINNRTIQLSTCDRLIEVVGANKPKVAKQIPLQIKNVSFDSAGTTLKGRFVTPVGKTPLNYVVLVHGSGSASGIKTFYHQYAYAALGMGVFVFDKRGTGVSDGEYTDDFESIAADAAAALSFVKKHAPTKVSKLGFSGYSQGGWIAPLAATKTKHADFVIVNYGMINSPLHEDKQQALCELKSQGFSEQQIAEAATLIDAIHDYGLNPKSRDIDALRLSHKDKAWFNQFEGEFSGRILEGKIKNLLGDDLPFRYNSIATLSQLKIPLLWMVAEKDRQAPPTDTIKLLAQRHQQDEQTSLLIVEDTDHGFLYFKTHGTERADTHYASELFKTKVNWVNHGFPQYALPKHVNSPDPWRWCLN